MADFTSQLNINDYQTNYLPRLLCFETPKNMDLYGDFTARNYANVQVRVDACLGESHCHTPGEISEYLHGKQLMVLYK